MVSFERMSRIMDILGKKKVISTTQLESLVYCSTSTLRRDLIALERDGKILRSHGEVRLANSNNIEYTYSARAHEEQRSKEIIADIASTFITYGGHRSRVKLTIVRRTYFAINFLCPFG